MTATTIDGTVRTAIREELQAIITRAIGHGFVVTALLEEPRSPARGPAHSEFIAPLGPEGVEALFGRVWSGWDPEHDAALGRMLDTAGLGRLDVRWQEFAAGGAWLMAFGFHRANKIEAGHLVTCGRQMLAAAINLRFAERRDSQPSTDGATE